MSSRRRNIFKIFITVISFVGIIFLKSSFDFKDLSNNYFSWSIAKNILYDIFVGIFSAMVLVWGIDEINNRHEEKEKEKQHFIVYNRLIPVFNVYYEFYLKMYIFTRKNKVLPGEKILNSLADCKDEFIRQIKESIPFYKEAFYIDVNKLRKQMRALANQVDDPKKIMEENISLPLYKCWCRDSTQFYDSIEKIEKNFLEFFPNELLIEIEKLLELVRPIKNLTNFIEMKQVKEIGLPIPNIELPQELELPVSFFIEDCKLEEIIDVLEDTIKYIEKDTGKFIRKRDIKFFNDRNVSPTIGEAYKVMKKFP